MWTGVYYPQDCPEDHKIRYREGDTTMWDNNNILEGPSYCVRLIVFEMPEDD